MRYYVKCLCRNCKRTFEVNISFHEFEPVKANEPIAPSCYSHDCYGEEIDEYGVADTIAFCKDDEFIH